MEVLLQELIEMVKGATPALWEAAMRRVTAMAIADSLIAIVLVLVIALTYKLVLKFSKEQSNMSVLHQSDAYPVAPVLYWIAAGVSVIVVVCEFYSVIMYLVSPEIAAIQVLTGLVK